MVSTSPLSTANGQPVDLTLTPSSGGFEPKNPLVPVMIGQQLQGGVTFPGAGFGFALQAAGSDQPLETSSGVFFGNVGGAADATDFQVNAVPSGAESFLQIRAASSPQSYVLHFQLPAGARLEIAQTDDPIAHDPPTAIEVVQGDTPLGYLYQPSAVDATGAPIPSHATIEGSNVVLSVSDQGAGVQYPVLLDPLVTTENSGNCTKDNGSPTWDGWSFGEWDTYENPSEQLWFGEAVDNCAYYPGLYTSMPPGNAFAAGNYGEYYITAPAGSYISGALFGGAGHAPYDSDLIMGLYEPTQNAFESGVYNDSGSAWVYGNPAVYGQEISNLTLGTCTIDCAAPGVDGNMAFFGIQAASTVHMGTNKAFVGADIGLLYLGDDHPPTVSGLPPSTTGWTNDANYSGTITAQDVGLGLTSVSYPGTNGATQTATLAPGCGDPYNGHQCPLSDPEPYSVSLPDGITTLQASATDVTGNTTNPVAASTMEIDTTPPPAPATSGLNSGDDFFAASPETLTITPTDPPAPGATASSGPATVSISLDGGTATTLACTSQCSWTPPADLPAGTHTASVYTTDNAGNVGPPKTISFQVEQGTGDSGYYQFTDLSDGVGVNVATGNLYVAATDLPDSSANADVVVNRYYNSEAPPGSGQLGQGWSFGVGPDLHLQASGSNVTVSGPTGWTLVFTQQSDGTYIPADPSSMTLAQNGSNWSLTDTANGFTYAFNQLGSLTGTMDAFSRVFTVATTTVSGILSLAQYALAGGGTANLVTNANGTIQKLIDPSNGTHL
jgi:hypothetical protein